VTGGINMPSLPSLYYDTAGVSGTGVTTLRDKKSTAISIKIPHGNAVPSANCRLNLSPSQPKMGVLMVNPTSPSVNIPALTAAVRLGASWTPMVMAVGVAPAIAAPSQIANPRANNR
jgi:hypothetical protein